jgi:trimethylamine--corrinoid protein Co-methyltransferase
MNVKTTLVQPNLSVLSQEQITKVHAYSLQILATTGVRVDSEQGLTLLTKAAGPGTVDGDRVRLPAELVEWALRKAPNSVDVYNRDGSLSFSLPGEARFGIGCTALNYQDPETDAVTPFARQHMQSMVRLGHNLANFEAISTLGIVQDVPPEVADLYASLDMVANTTKPLIILVSEEDLFAPALDLLEHLHGDLADRPFVVPYFNPISPLVINGGTVDKMIEASARGLPYIYSNYGMAGASTPITPAGTLALLNAELLAGLVLSQLIKEGSPIILGSLPAYFDMKGMGSFYDPRSYLIGLACAEMMDHYGLPHAGTSGSGIGWGADLLAGGHQWLNHLVTCMGKPGLAPFVGDNLDSKAFAPAIVVLANEIIAQARILAGGFALDDDTVALGEIDQIGPGGSYLMADSTLSLFRTAYFQSDIFPILTMEEWLAQGSPRADNLLRAYTRQMIEDALPPEDQAELTAVGTAFIQRRTGR